MRPSGFEPACWGSTRWTGWDRRSTSAGCPRPSPNPQGWWLWCERYPGPACPPRGCCGCRPRRRPLPRPLSRPSWNIWRRALAYNDRSLSPGMKRLLSLLLLALACRESPSDPVILSLKGQVVRRSDFERYLAAMEARNGPLPAEVRQALLETYIERRVLVLEARLRGLLPPDAKDEDEAGAVQRLVDQQLASQVQVGEDEIGRLH